jgi:alpha-beta hydrolase superfamily lysophospholipase
MKIIHKKLKNTQDISIRCAHSNNLESASKILFFLNGRSEWVEKFMTLIESLDLSEDTAWVSWDHRGQGGSGGKPSHVDDYGIFARDTQELVADFAKNRPYSMVCHSMGSLIATVATLKGYIKPKSLFLLSPLFGLPKKPLPHVIGVPLASYATKLGFGGINLGFDKHLNISFARNRLTHSAENYRIILDYPFKWSGPTFGWIHATFQACKFIHDRSSLKAYKGETHFYVLGGTDERVVDAEAFRTWSDACKEFHPCELKIIEGARHELHMESKEYFSQAVDYLKANITY